MYRGLATTELYEDSIKRGFCDEHLKELQVKNESEKHELQRKALLYIRLQILRPILFNKPFPNEKIKTLMEGAGYFNVNKHCCVTREEFIEQVLILDSVIVFTLAKLCQLCCAGALFQTNHRLSTDNPFLKLLTQKALDGNDVAQFAPSLNANFFEYEQGITKISYVAVLLFVRNVAMFLDLKNVLEKQDLDFQSSSAESVQWNDIGSDAYKRQSWVEAINAYSKAIEFNPYCISLLLNRAQVYMRVNKIKDSALDYYLTLMIKPSHFSAYCKWASSLYIQSQLSECLKVVEYGLTKFEHLKSFDPKYQALERIKAEATLDLKKKMNSESKKPVSNPPKKKDLPELVEASDSETESQDVPELMDASNSDESDSESESTKNKSKTKSEPTASGPSVELQKKSEKNNAKEPASKTTRARNSSGSEVREQKIDNQVNLEKSKAKESTTKTTRVKSASVSEVCTQKDDSEEKIKMLQMSLKDASNTLLDGCGLMAMRRFRDALDEIKASPEIHKFEECDITCIKYAYAFACYQSGGYDDLQKAISVLQEITEEHKNITFPAAYYTIGLTFHKLNRFKQALQYLKIVDDILQKGIHAKVYVWPGLAIAINETKLDYLKNSLPTLMKECENPPSPDATCLYEGCTLQSSIYYTDPDFKGFFIINCSEQCNLQYHPQCWKSIKTSKNCSDKLFLEQQCFTPDCEGIIIKLQCINKEGNIDKEFVHADGKKSFKPKKSKLEKKLEIREEKRRKRKDSSSRTDSVSEVPEDIVNDKPNENKAINFINEPENQTNSETKDNNGNINEPIAPQHPVNAEPLIVLKKEKFPLETSNKSSTKVKEHKKIKNNTYSIDEFLQHTDTSLYNNEYEQRLNMLRQNNQNSTAGILSKSNVNNSSDKPMVESFATDGVQPLSSSMHSLTNSLEETKTEDTGLDDFPEIELSKPLVVSECLKEKIYNYFKELLGKCGPMRVDDPALLEKIKSFPEDGRMIVDSGGIGKFLQQNLEFAFVKDLYICLVEQLPVAYRKINEPSLPIDDSDLKLSDNYESFSGADKNSSEIFRFSGLNPDAREYQPGTDKSSRHHSEDNITEMGEQDRSSPEFISKFRQTLKKDRDNASKNGEFSSDALSSPVINTEEMDHSRTSSFSSSNSFSQNLPDAYTYSGNKVTEFVNTFKELIRMYYSEEMKEHRPFIDVYLKPYTIGCIPKKYTRSVQTEETEKVSRGTMKTDDEILELKDMTSQLIQERKILEQEYHAALEYATKFQNKSNVEVAHLKKELEDKIASLDGVEKQFKSKEEKLEKEIKILSENLKKIKVENVAQKKEMEKVLATKDSLLNDRAHLEERVFSLQQEEQKLRESINEGSKLKSDMEKIELEKDAADKRAKSAELLLLHLKKTEFLKRIDIKKGEAAKKIKEMQDGAAMFSGHLTPLYTKNIEDLLTQIRNYLKLLEDIKVNFTANIDEQINEVNNGVPLAQLQPLEVQELPDIPTWNEQQMTSVFNSQSTWSTPNSIYNAGSFNPFSYSAFDPLSLKSNVPGLQKPNQGSNQQIPVQNGPYGSGGDSFAQPSNVSVPPTTKAPPGLENTIVSSIHAPATSMGNLNTSLVQSKKFASNSNIAAATKVNSSEGKAQFAYAAAAASPPDVVETESQKKISASSLELDYKVKKNEPMETPVPPSTNLAPNIPSTEAKKIADKGAKRSFEKLLSKLQEKFPKYSHTELMDCVKEFRTKRGSGLSGLSLDTVINSVGEILEAKMRAKLEERVKNVTSQVPQPVLKPKTLSNAVLVNKKLVDEGKVKEPPAVKETSASAPKKSAWGVSESENSKQWTGNQIDKDCIICYEEMTYKTAYKVDCGHHFHFKCIKEWLDKKSDCPICRVHLLLPEDYPALS